MGAPPLIILVSPPKQKRINPKHLKFRRAFPPLSFLIAASSLRNHGFQVEILDLNSRPDRLTSDAIQRMKDAFLTVVSTSDYSDWQCPPMQIDFIFDFIQEVRPGRLVITGNHGTHYPAGILKKTEALAIVREEDEKTILEVALALKNETQLSEIAGISYSQNASIIHNPSRPLEKMTDLPDPAYDLVDLNDYRYELLGERFALLEASRGCPYTCNFCNRSMFQNKYRKSELERVCRQIETLVEKHDCQSLYIFDLEFTINRKMAEGISKFLIEKNYVNTRNFRWCCQTRADSVDDSLCALLKQSGCEIIHFGVESGNPTILEATHKRIQIENIRKGFSAAHKARIKTAAFLIFGHPHETDSQREDTLRFALELNPTFASFHVIIPFPGSPLFEEKFGQGPYWNQDYPGHFTYLTPEEDAHLKTFTKKAYFKFYLRPLKVLDYVRNTSFKLLWQQFQLFLDFTQSSQPAAIDRERLSGHS